MFAVLGSFKCTCGLDGVDAPARRTGASIPGGCGGKSAGLGRESGYSSDGVDAATAEQRQNSQYPPLEVRVYTEASLRRLAKIIFGPGNGLQSVTLDALTKVP